MSIISSPALDMVIKSIKSIEKKTFVLEALAMAPDYFWTVPASSTGKYHPSISQGEGGLLRHTIAATKIAISMFDAYPEFTNNDKDNIIVALLLHDTLKKDFPETEHTVKNHEVLPRYYYTAIAELIGQEQYNLIMDMVDTHMGIWNHSGIPPTPDELYRISPAEMVHLADYLSSRKLFDTLFLVVGQNKNPLIPNI